MGVCFTKGRGVLAAIVFFSFVSTAGAFQVSLFVPREDTVFWASLVALTRDSAHDLGVDLKVYSAGNRRDIMLEQVARACNGGTDGILFMNYEGVGEAILGLAESHKVPAFLYNTGFVDPRRVPRKRYPHWIGSMTPDDVRAGALLAERLIALEKGAGEAEIRMLAIQGNPKEKSSMDRVLGLRSVVDQRDDVVLYDVVDAGKAWSRSRAKEVFKIELGKHPRINTVWAAGDDIALGVQDAMAEMGFDAGTVSTGGVDWSNDAVESIRLRHNRLSIGGHMLEGAWALVLMHDYLQGMDFSQENTVFKTRMHAIGRNNVGQMSSFLSDDWKRIDFRRFSKYRQDTFLYRFDLLYLMETFYPKRGAFKLTDEERAWLADHATVRLGIDVNWLPFESLDASGRYEGMVADYVGLIEERLGVQCVYSTDRTWSETLGAMQNQQLDMIAAIVDTEEARERMVLTEPYLSFPLVVITNDRVDFVQDLSDLKGKKVAVVRDYSEHTILSREYPELDLRPVCTTTEALESVATGLSEAYVGNLAVANHAIRRARLTNLKVSGTLPMKLDISMGVRKDWPILANLVAKTVASITDKERDSIYRRWITLRYEHGMNYALFWKFGAVGGGLLMVFAYWTRRLFLLNRTLKREIGERVRVEEALRREQETVKQLAVTDPLTGLFNRRKLTEVFPMEVRRLRRSGKYLTFATMDIDFFKQYNDCYGHQMGDDVLTRVGDFFLERCQRATDYVFRLGGEEFGILFVARDPDRAVAFVEKLRQGIQDLGIEHRGSTIADSLTVSFGLVVSSNPTQMDAMYKCADRALYRAKEAGRNRSMLDPLQPEVAESA